MMTNEGPSKNDIVLSMIQDLARKMLETGGAEPYAFEAHSAACNAVMKVLSALAKQENVQ